MGSDYRETVVAGKNAKANSRTYFGPALGFEAMDYPKLEEH
jgi:hypothetical protein